MLSNNTFVVLIENRIEIHSNNITKKMEIVFAKLEKLDFLIQIMR